MAGIVAGALACPKLSYASEKATVVMQYWGSPTSDVMAKTTSPEAAVNGWMNSPGHRANILNPAYRESGIAVLRGVPVSGAPADHDGYVFIQCFGGCEQPGGSRHPGE